MKKVVLITAVLALLTSCGKGDRGQLVGAKGKKWHPEKPFGMELVPGGAFIMGKSDDDLAGVKNAPTKTVTVRSFYMDATEITNDEYRQFVEWVRDSIIRTKLAILADEFACFFAALPGRHHGPDWSQGDCATVMNHQVELVSFLEACEIEQCGVKDDAAGVADLLDGLDHT